MTKYTGKGVAVDAGPVTAHLRVLREYGIGYPRLAELVGCSQNHVRAIHDGFRMRRGVREVITSVSEVHARRILAIKPEQRFCGRMDRLDSRGASRRLQALFAVGWGGRYLAERVGTSMSYLNSTAAGRSSITPERDWRIRVLYAELWNQTPPQRTRQEKVAYGRAVEAARRNGWVGPLGWDDIDNDDEPANAPDHNEEVVDEVKILLAMEGRTVVLNPDERVETVRRLTLQELNDTQIGNLLGMTPAGIFKIRQRNQIHRQEHLSTAA